jgi:glycine rich protein
MRSRLAARLTVGVLAGVILSGAVGVPVASASTQTYTSPGSYSFTVPDGITHVAITAVGAAGSSCVAAVGGEGASVSADIPVTGEEELYVVVGGPGGGASTCGDAGQPGGAGGTGGGGTGGTGGGDGGGGGASYVGPGSGAPDFDELLIVAGGGGGAAYETGNGGAAGHTGQTVANQSGGVSTGGGAGTQEQGGSGGTDGTNAGMTGAELMGETGAAGDANSLGGGGGGGGGYWGGGGGGPSAGGGGGSSFVTSTAINVSAAQDTSSASEVTIQYPAPLNPTAAISSPAQSGGTYLLGESVQTSFSCTEGADGPGLSSCDDSNGTDTTSGGTGTLNTSFVGSHSYEVTATSSDGYIGTTSIYYTVAVPPTASIASPSSSGNVYALNSVVLTSFSCADSSRGPGLSSCDDSNGTSTTSGGSGQLDTSSVGPFTYTVTATSADGATGTASVNYSVAAPPTASISSPAPGGTYYVGQSVATSISCAPGDGTPGSVSCGDSNDDSDMLDTSTLGAHTYTATAYAQDGLTGTASISYTVVGLPSATIASPESGGTYTLGQVVATSFSCADAAGAAGLSSCDDSNGTSTTSGGTGTLNTSSVGSHTYTVTATSQDGGTSSTSITYDVVGSPSAAVFSPSSGGTYTLGEVVGISFGCTEATGGPGLSSCVDSNGTSTISGGRGVLDTATAGTHTYTVTATSSDGLSATASITYTVVGPPTATIVSPSSGGTYVVGQPVPTSFSCADATGAPGLASCEDSNGTDTTTGGSGPLDTSSVGSYTYAVTATSSDGLTSITSITYQVTAAHTATVARVSITSSRSTVVRGKATVTLACAGTAACDGTLTLTSGTVVLGHAGYAVADGHTEAVVLHISRAGMALVAKAKHRGLSVKATATTTGGGTSQRVIVLRI